MKWFKDLFFTIPEDTRETRIDYWPPEVPVLLLKDTVLLPGTTLPLIVSNPISMSLIKGLRTNNDYVVAVGIKKTNNMTLPTWDKIYKTGCLIKTVRTTEINKGEMSVMVKGLKRVRLEEKVSENPWLMVRVSYIDENIEVNKQVSAMAHSIRQILNQLARFSYHNMDSVLVNICKLREPVVLLNVCTTILPLPIEKKQAILEEDTLLERYSMLHEALKEELNVLEISFKITEKTRGEINNVQREYYLRQQLKTIKKELGETEDIDNEIEELKKEIEAKALPEEVKKDVEKDMRRLTRMQPSSAEYATIRTYMDWILDLPWHEQTQDNLDISRVEAILDKDHFNLKKPKKRILEFLAVKALKKELKGPILCFAGPPGVGKTSLGKSIARAMGRNFVRISLGGIHDEAEIRGHRRTYIGAMPGRIINGMKQAGTLNPVFMLDEIDKLTHDIHGDPSSALLEALDPEQNSRFVDHYLNVGYDLSKVFFITTANVIDTIPPALRDRMEIVEIDGYTQEDKLQIAKHYLIPKEIEANGLEDKDIRFSDEAIGHIISSYTRESGVRNLQRMVASVLRVIASNIAKYGENTFDIDSAFVEEALGPVRFIPEIRRRTDIPGVATGLAWTPFGGDILFVESALVEGNDEMILTGQMGDIMKESAKIALSLVKSMGYKIPKGSHLHIHVPAGAIQKDGPSAGITMVISMVSLLTGKRVYEDLAMTGEITLRGIILPVGGIREKVLAARRAGIMNVALPQMNKKDLEEIDKNAIKDMHIHFVQTIDDVLRLAFPDEESKNATLPMITNTDEEKRVNPFFS